MLFFFPTRCIGECLNRKHICPLCNAAVTIKECYANHQVDNLLALLLKEKEDASKRYFNKLLTRSGDGGGGAASAAPAGPAAPAASGGAAKFSPVEALFQKHMRKV